ncbi:hypothetical protein L618_000100002330 [Rhodococcus rhodochrous J45]|uniref:Response regulatory domain-containing protein n=1 Tax=Rhodococcus rhodochrous J45 TaxID=935266 RepID=A0A562ESD3_RHORH|nr:hypothetical protein L618_000100002330 [Rhodococcus rhodochrous J45]
MTDPADPIVVLLVEDDPEDELRTRDAFADHKITNAVHVVRTGEQALQFLHRHGACTEMRSARIWSCSI